MLQNSTEGLTSVIGRWDADELTLVDVRGTGMTHGQRVCGCGEAQLTMRAEVFLNANRLPGC